MAALGWLLNLDFAGSGATAAAGGASYVTRIEQREPAWPKRWRSGGWSWFRLLRTGYGLRT